VWIFGGWLKKSVKQAKQKTVVELFFVVSVLFMEKIKKWEFYLAS
jgi:hypothetical protein